MSGYTHPLNLTTTSKARLNQTRFHRCFKISVLFLVTFFLTAFNNTNVKADELSLIINGKAIHMTKKPDVKYNERNLGIGLQYQFNRINRNWYPYIYAGGFSDSNDNTSYYLGAGASYRFKAPKYLPGIHIDAGLNSFLMTREDVNDNTPFPGVLPMLSIGNRTTALNIIYIPEIANKTEEILFMQLKIRLARI